MRCRVRYRRGKRQRVGRVNKRERWLQRDRQRWRRKAVSDHTGDAFEMARPAPIAGIRRTFLIDGNADRRERQRVRLAGVCACRHCGKGGLKNQRERCEPDNGKTGGAENIPAARHAANRSGNVSEQAPEARALTRRSVHPLRDQLTLVPPRLQPGPHRCRGFHLVNHRSTLAAIRRSNAILHKPVAVECASIRMKHAVRITWKYFSS